MSQKGRTGPSQVSLPRRPAWVLVTAAQRMRTGDGRSPDLRVVAFPILPGPKTQWRFGVAHRLQLRGQSRLWAEARTVFPFQPVHHKERSGTIPRTVARQRSLVKTKEIGPGNSPLQSSLGISGEKPVDL